MLALTKSKKKYDFQAEGSAINSLLANSVSCDITGTVW